MKPVSSMKLNLKKFDPAKIKPDSTVIFLGKRHTGKSFALKDILSYHKDLPIGVVISPTEVANKHFEKFIPRMLIHDEYDPDIVNKFLKRQVKLTEKINQDMEKYGTASTDGRAFLILDDCLYSAKDWVNNKDIRSIFMNGRHYNIFFLMTAQYPMGIPPTLRTNIDYVFIFREPVVKNQMRLYDAYAGCFPNFESFRQTLLQTTNNYECMVIDNKTQSNNLEDQVFWYKASEKKFKMCDAELWDMQAINDQKKAMGLDNNDDDETDMSFDPNIVVKHKCNIKVNKKN